MSILDIFTHSLISYLKGKRDRIKHNSENTRINKRALFHQNIPDLEEVRASFGHNYDELKDLLEKYDPSPEPKLKEVPGKYVFISKTLIYQLKSKRTEKEVETLVQREFILWFGNSFLQFHKRDSLIEDIMNLKAKLR
jgi:hypothetical protein